MQSDCKPDIARETIISDCGPSKFPDGYHSTARSPPPEKPLLRTRSRSPVEEPPVRARSKSPHAKRPTFQRIYDSIHRYGQLERIRVSPHRNRNLTFELRRYTFPADRPVQLRLGNTPNSYAPMPTTEQIVLSTLDGDVVAILEKTNCLVAIYNRRRVRAKINMSTGTVTKMEPEEVSNSPVGRRIPISANYIVLRAILDLNE